MGDPSDSYPHSPEKAAKEPAPFMTFVRSTPPPPPPLQNLLKALPPLPPFATLDQTSGLYGPINTSWPFASPATPSEPKEAFASAQDHNDNLYRWPSTLRHQDISHEEQYSPHQRPRYPTHHSEGVVKEIPYVIPLNISTRSIRPSRARISDTSSASPGRSHFETKEADPYAWPSAFTRPRWEENNRGSNNYVLPVPLMERLTLQSSPDRTYPTSGSVSPTNRVEVSTPTKYQDKMKRADHTDEQHQDSSASEYSNSPTELSSGHGFTSTSCQHGNDLESDHDSHHESDDPSIRELYDPLSQLSTMLHRPVAQHTHQPASGPAVERVRGLEEFVKAYEELLAEQGIGPNPVLPSNAKRDIAADISIVPPPVQSLIPSQKARAEALQYDQEVSRRIRFVDAGPNATLPSRARAPDTCASEISWPMGRPKNLQALADLQEPPELTGSLSTTRLTNRPASPPLLGCFARTSSSGPPEISWPATHTRKPSSSMLSSSHARRVLTKRASKLTSGVKASMRTVGQRITDGLVGDEPTKLLYPKSAASVAATAAKRAAKKRAQEREKLIKSVEVVKDGSGRTWI